MWDTLKQVVNKVLSSPEVRQVIYTAIEVVIRIFSDRNPPNPPNPPTLPPQS